MGQVFIARTIVVAVGAWLLGSCAGLSEPAPRTPPTQPATAPAAGAAASSVASFSPLVQPSAMHQYLGCFRDQGTRTGTDGRDLNGAFTNDPRMTTQMCVDQCRAKGFAYAGTQRSTYCFCGNSYGRSGPAENCSARCAGKSDEVCGGVWSNSVYAIGTLAVRAPVLPGSARLSP
jgi:WSC domain